MSLIRKDKYNKRIWLKNRKKDAQWKRLMKIFRYYKVVRKKKGCVKFSVMRRTVFNELYPEMENKIQWPKGDSLYYIPKDNNEPEPVPNRIKVVYSPITKDSYDGSSIGRLIADEYCCYNKNL